MILTSSSKYFDEGLDLTEPDVYASARLSFGKASRLIPTVYRSKAFANLEDERIWTRAWVCVGFEQQIPNPGDLLPVTVGNHGIHVQRQKDGSLKAAFNMAQHGGCRFVPVQCQTGKKTKCFYTSCGYSRDRDVIRAPENGEEILEMRQFIGYNPAKLLPVKVDTWENFIFVSLDPDSAPLKQQLGNLPRAKNYFAPSLVHVSRLNFEVGCNWKLTGKQFMDADYIPSATCCWVFPNLLLVFMPNHVASIIVQPNGPIDCLEYLDIFWSRENVDSPLVEVEKQKLTNFWNIAQQKEIGILNEGQVKMHYSKETNDIKPKLVIEANYKNYWFQQVFLDHILAK